LYSLFLKSGLVCCILSSGHYIPVYASFLKKAQIEIRLTFIIKIQAQVARKSTVTVAKVYMFVSLPSTAVYTFVSLRQAFRCRFRLHGIFSCISANATLIRGQKSDFAISFRLICKPSYLPAFLMEHL
jgi:hypothetical protein